MGHQDVQPNNPNNTTPSSQTPSPSDRSVPSLSRGTTDEQRQAAADLTRSQIDRIYEHDSPYKQFETEEKGEAQTTLNPAEHLQKYHTAWQDYYQKYYESYYTHAIRQTQEQLRRKAEVTHKPEPSAIYSDDQKAASDAVDGTADTPKTAVKKLQSQFKEKVRTRASKVRRSRHFWPLITAGTVAVVFLFLQYNRLLVANVAAYVSPGSVDPQNIIVDPTTDTKVGPDPKLIIPKINVDAPVIYSVAKYDNDEIEANLKNGVVKYPIPGANAFPGQVGNLVIGGHSSNDVFDNGGYKFVFVQLEKMAIGDTMYINYQGTRYTYHVTKTQTIEPNQTSLLTAPVTKPTVTLVTCTPVGTALHRFLVIAEQVSPDPSGAAVSTDAGTSSDATTIPGNAPSLLEQIFGR